jgi:hypothetical protein
LLLRCWRCSTKRDTTTARRSDPSPTRGARHPHGIHGAPSSTLNRHRTPPASGGGASTIESVEPPAAAARLPGDRRCGAATPRLDRRPPHSQRRDRRRPCSLRDATGGSPAPARCYRRQPCSPVNTTLASDGPTLSSLVISGAAPSPAGLCASSSSTWNHDLATM